MVVGQVEFVEQASAGVVPEFALALCVPELGFVGESLLGVVVDGFGFVGHGFVWVLGVAVV